MTKTILITAERLGALSEKQAEERQNGWRVIDVEKELNGVLTLAGRPVKMKVDRIDRHDDGRVRVVDYKTGRSPGERFEGKALFQMKFYALVLWRSRGEIPRLLQLVYLGDGQVVRYVPDEHDLRALARNLQAVWAAVERAAHTGDWRPSPSKLCGWCDFQEFCPEFGGTPPPLPADATRLVLDPRVSGAVAPADD